MLAAAAQLGVASMAAAVVSRRPQPLITRLVVHAVPTTWWRAAHPLAMRTWSTMTRVWVWVAAWWALAAAWTPPRVWAALSSRFPRLVRRLLAVCAQAAQASTICPTTTLSTLPSGQRWTRLRQSLCRMAACRGAVARWVPRPMLHLAVAAARLPARQVCATTSNSSISMRTCHRRRAMWACEAVAAAVVACQRLAASTWAAAASCLRT